jgi:hypothetical protein
MTGSFVICFHTARIENLLQTLRFLVKNHPEVVHDSQLEAVCQDNIDDLPQSQFDELDAIRENFHRSCISSYCIKHMHLPHLTNQAIEHAENDKIVILESDRILPPGYFAKVFDEIKEGVQITCNKMHRLTEPATDEQIANSTYKSVDEYRSHSNQIGQRNAWSGNTAIWRPDWEKAGRMDEAYKGYGWADSDMTWAMEKVGVQTVFRDELELHLWHPPATYGEGHRATMFMENGLYFCKKWNQPIPVFLREEIAKNKKVVML